MKNKTKSSKNSLFNRLVAWIHLWPSIVSGIIVVFVCLTGTIIVYNDEILNITAGDARFVEVPIEKKYVTEEEIHDKILALNPHYEISEFVFYKDPNRSIKLRCFDKEKKGLLNVYVNPYTAEILKVDKTIHFFFVTAHLHSSLLAGKTGSWIVAISTIIFTISCLTGLILWWPKKWNKATRQASFTIKWKARFKRFNYDLHNVYGFYSLAICLVLGVTGLLIFFKPLMNLTIKASGGSTDHLEKALPKLDSSKPKIDFVTLAYQTLAKTSANEISMWHSDDENVGAYAFSTGEAELRSTENKIIHIIDRHTGKEIELDDSLIKHETTENVVWQLHMGQWWGWIGKLSSFLAGIIATSLPITGFLIWWGKRKKKVKSLKRTT